MAFPTPLKNLRIVLKVLLLRIRALAARIVKNPQFDPSGFHLGRTQMVLGLFYKINNRHALAVQHLTGQSASFPIRPDRGSGEG